MNIVASKVAVKIHNHGVACFTLLFHKRMPLKLTLKTAEFSLAGSYIKS